MDNPSAPLQKSSHNRGVLRDRCGTVEFSRFTKCDKGSGISYLEDKERLREE